MSNELKTYNVERLLVVALETIDRQMRNRSRELYKKEMDSPFANTGSRFSNNVFSVSAYDWRESDDPEPNFTWRNVKVWWYKCLGRGMEWEKDDGSDLTPDDVNQMLNECLDSLDDFRKWLNTAVSEAEKAESEAEVPECGTTGCVFWADGECKYSLVYGHQPKITKDDGCKDGDYVGPFYSRLYAE